MKRNSISHVLYLLALILFLTRCDTVEPEVKQDLKSPIEMAFVHVTGGTFTMGDIAGVGLSVEQPVHAVTLTHDFSIGKYEVTQAEYMAVMHDNPSYFTGNNRLPADNISWYDAIHFTNILSIRSGLAPCYDSDGNVVGGDGNPYECEGYRLPTEAEWEYATRAGTTTPFSFGENDADLSDHAWYAQNAGSRTHPVGEKQPNPWGLYDVHGNVWEWAYDRYAPQYKSDGPETDPIGSPSGTERVKRGGSWDRSPEYLRPAFRSGYEPAYAYYNFGFRVARTAL